MPKAQQWTHAQCDSCWIKEMGLDQPPARLRKREHEACCYCGEVTASGIYRRVRPSSGELARCSHRGIDMRLFR